MKKIFTLLLILPFTQAFSQTLSNTPVIVQAKNPATAFVSSMVLPGLGQMYNEQVEKGLIIFGSQIGLSYAAIKIGVDPDYTDGSKAVVYGLAGVLYLYQILDAPLTADKINRLNKAKSYHNKWTLQQNNNGLGLAYHF